MSEWRASSTLAHLLLAMLGYDWREEDTLHLLIVTIGSILNTLRHFTL